MNDIARTATQYWLVFYAGSLAFSLVARRLGHPSFLPRLMLWFVLIPLFLGSAYLGPPYFFALLTCACLVACVEIARLTPALDTPGASSRFGLYSIAVIAAVPWMYWALLEAGLPWQTVPVASAGPVLLYQGIGRTVEGSGARGNAGIPRSSRSLLQQIISVPTLREAGPLILLSVGLGVGLACWLRMLVMPGGFRFVLFAYSVVAINDIGAGVFGELFGRIRPLPRLSPNKTVAGFIGGAASGILVSYLGWFAVPELSLTQITAAGVLLVSSGAAGDLFASGVKRRHGLKDFGTVMGPCGGILDRLDSLLSSGPVFYLYLQLVM